MNFMKKFAVVCCVMSGVLFINGCSEGSTSFEQKTTVEVSTSSGINYSSSYSETRSENGIFVYKINDANLLDGKAEIYLSITNNGKRDTTLNEITIKFTATDSNGKFISEGNSHFNNLAISLPQNTEVYERFIIEDPDYKRFDDNFHIDCSFEEVVINPDVQ